MDFRGSPPMKERIIFLTPEERDITNNYRTPENSILFIYKLAILKPRRCFFSFKFNEVQADVQYILQQHFSFSPDLHLDEPILRQTKYVQQQKILELYGHRACNTLERTHPGKVL